MNAEISGELPLPQGSEEVRRRFQELRWQERTLAEQLEKNQTKIAEIGAYLNRAPKIVDRLDQLSQKMFGDILDEVERHLTYALREVLEQDLKVITTREVKKGKVSITFGIERKGEREDILTGQGGSVCNII